MATGQFSKVLVTATGKEMIAQSQSGKTLTFTRVALGDGLVVDGEDISAFTAVKNECLSLPIAEYTALDNGQFRVQFRVNNQSVTTGFWHREIGIMAKIDNGTEKLYAYTTAGNQGNFIYDKTTPVDERVINVDFVVGDSGSVMEEISKEKQLDCLIVDPPRTGLDEKMINSILNSNAKKLIYVSCNPSTLAKNLNVLKEYYNIESIRAIDVFSNTEHVESIVYLARM